MSYDRRPRCLIVACAFVLSSAAHAGDSPQPLLYAGLEHHTLGNADLFINQQDQLEISNIGDSGKDGALIVLGDAEGWRGGIHFGPSGALPPGTRLDLSNAVNLDGTATQWQISIQETDGGLAAVSLNLNPECADCTLLVGAMLNGTMVDTVQHKAPFPPELARGALGALDFRFRLAEADGESTANCELRNSVVASTPITLSGSARGPVDADTIVIRLTGLPPGRPVANSLAITAANTATLLVTDEALVQFNADHRSMGGVTLLGQLGKDRSPAVLVGDIDLYPVLGQGVSFAPPDSNFLVAEPAPVVQRVEFDLDFTPSQSTIVDVTWVTTGRAQNGAESFLAISWINLTVQGGRYMGLGDSKWLLDREILITARLNGAITAQALVPNDGFNMWSSGGQTPLPDTYAFELLPTDDPSCGSFRQVCRWESPVSLFVVSPPLVAADEVEVLVIGPLAPSEQPVAVYQTILDFTSYSDLLPVEVSIKREKLLPGSQACAADVAPPETGGNGVIDSDDLFALLAAWGFNIPHFDIAPPRGNGVVDIDDLFELLAAWGPCS